MQLSLITVNYGGSKNIQKLIQSLAKVPETWELIIVDNASPNNDADNLDSLQSDQVHVIKLQHNLGFGGGYMEGIPFATGDYLGIINPDIEVAVDTFTELLKVHQSDPSIGMVVPQLQNPDGTPQYNLRPFPSLWQMAKRRFFRAPIHFEIQGKEPQSIPWAQGSFLFMKRTFFVDVLKGFDPRYFLFLEDTDLCRTTWENHKKVVLVPKATATHGVERLSDSPNLWTMLRKKTFWIHVHSTFKYFLKYLFRAAPKVVPFEAESKILGHIYFISGPSGVGKGTVINMIRERCPEFVFPVSCTTRARRPGEVDGGTYHFVTKDVFEVKIEAGEFMEYAHVHGKNYYGTLLKPHLEGVEQGKVVVREFDVQGYLQARDRLPAGTFTSIFIAPDGPVEELVERILDRAPMSEEELKKRLESMQKELNLKHEYHHVVESVGGQQEKLYQDVMAIIQGNG